MRRPRRNHTAKFKATVALAAIRGDPRRSAAIRSDKTLAQLSEKCDVHAKQIVQWKIQLAGCALDVFMTATENGTRPALRLPRDGAAAPSSATRSCRRRMCPPERHRHQGAWDFICQLRR